MAQEYESSGRRTQGRRHTPSRLEQSGGRRTQHPAGERNSSSGSRTPRRSKKRRSSFGPLLYVIFVIGISALLAAVGWIAANDLLALNKPEHSAVITLEEGDTVGEVADLLEENGLIEYKWLFTLFASFTHVDDVSPNSKLTPGTYELNTSMDYNALINSMGRGSSNRKQTEVTITEGMTLDQIFQALEDAGVAKVEDLQDVAANHAFNYSFLKDLPTGDYHRLEGYLFPDTYQFYMGGDVLQILNRMILRFDELFTDEMRQDAEKSGYTVGEIVIIASLIEKETDGTDQALISSVIHNRLENPGASTAGYLNIDAALAYINGGKAPTAADKEIDSPYNTYKYKGLPPTAIANPGIDAIKAAIYPDSTNYYYYALGDDGTHSFFRTLREQQNFIASQDRYN
ncbi:hypothetical protein B5G43_04355 [Flavonifractor sp. An92]|uniref:endolytic transglycosylase MltG n=1 Tax=Flavonifractor sp. An92 TaxID=1965666 RepID=UPI000B38C0DF|nr:endolytic transglycosylase MltG [Flavonifractor sp. An92]OUN07569.1 hypothetical protein B5G43_04355 [Flavonifractor sp. An92]